VGGVIMDNKKVGNFISTMRKSLRFTQQEMAEILGVTNKAVSKWETGEGYPEITIVPAIAEILGVTVDELLKGEKSKSQKLEPASSESSKQCEYLLDKAVLEFKNAHIITTGISVLGIVLSFIIAFSTPYRSSSVFGIILVVLSISVFLMNYNSVKASCEKYLQLYPDNNKTLIYRNRVHRSLILSVWLWTFSSCIIIAFVLPEKLFSRFATTYRFHILFMIGMVIASIISGIIQIQRKDRIE
jgi:transcriptional regulator with XRE-family HTH domain